MESLIDQYDRTHMTAYSRVSKVFFTAITTRELRSTLSESKYTPTFL